MKVDANQALQGESYVGSAQSKSAKGYAEKNIPRVSAEWKGQKSRSVTFEVFGFTH